MRWVGRGTRTRRDEICARILVGIPEEKRPLGKLRSREKGNIKIDIKETWCGLDSTGTG
jgi:hypothetical protein